MARSEGAGPEPVRIEVGERITLELDANPTTGFGWELTEAPESTVARVVSDVYLPPERQLPGAGGVQQFVVEGVAIGRSTLALAYLRPWETDDPPARTVQFEITVV